MLKHQGGHVLQVALAHNLQTTTREDVCRHVQQTTMALMLIRQPTNVLGSVLQGIGHTTAQKAVRIIVRMANGRIMSQSSVCQDAHQHHCPMV